MILAQQDANAELEDYVQAYEGDHLDLLESMTSGLAQRLVDDPTLRAAMRLAVERGEEEDTVISETYETWERLVADVAATARARGELAEHVDPARLARFLVAAFTGLQTVSLVSSGLEDLQARVDDMWSLPAVGSGRGSASSASAPRGGAHVVEMESGATEVRRRQRPAAG